MARLEMLSLALQALISRHTNPSLTTHGLQVRLWPAWKHSTMLLSRHINLSHSTTACRCKTPSLAGVPTAPWSVSSCRGCISGTSPMRRTRRGDVGGRRGLGATRSRCVVCVDMGHPYWRCLTPLPSPLLTVKVRGVWCGPAGACWLYARALSHAIRHTPYSIHHTPA